MMRIDYTNETIMPALSFYNKFEGLLIVNPESLKRYENTIRTDENCRYPNLTLILLIHIMVNMDCQNQCNISARHLAKRIGANYDTVTKCLKYLRSINAIGSTN